jgi:hypothetical protein
MTRRTSKIKKCSALCSQRGLKVLNNQLLTYDITDEDKKDFLNDVRSRLSKHTPDMLFSKFNDAWNESLDALKMKMLSPK